jgi:DNA-binding response OmpR family regulator
VQATTALDILLVDDDRPLREMLTRSFEREGHRVTAVPDGETALDAASERSYDVVLLDVALGAGPTGYDVARMLRNRRDVVPIIMLTALDSEADAVQGLEASRSAWPSCGAGSAPCCGARRAAWWRATFVSDR